MLLALGGRRLWCHSLLLYETRSVQVAGFGDLRCIGMHPLAIAVLSISKAGKTLQSAAAPMTLTPGAVIRIAPQLIGTSTCAQQQLHEMPQARGVPASGVMPSATVAD